MFGQIELFCTERGRFIELRIEIDEIVRLYLMEWLVLDQFFKLEANFFRTVRHCFLLLLLAEMKGLILLKMGRLIVRVRFDLILTAVEHEIEHFQVTIHDAFLLACLFLVHVERVGIDHVEFDGWINLYLLLLYQFLPLVLKILAKHYFLLLHWQEYSLFVQQK